MKRALISSFYLAFLLFFFLPSSADAVTPTVDNLSGKIMLQVEENGEAWYLNPQSQKRVFLGKPRAAWEVINQLSVVVSDEALALIKNSEAPKMLSGLFVRAEDAILYIHPSYPLAIELHNSTDVYYLMRNFGTGIRNMDLERIAIQDSNVLDLPTLNLSSLNNLNHWWGRINTGYTPVYVGTSTQAKPIGWLWPSNRVKVLKEVPGEIINNNNLWYQIDGGAYPGAFVHSSYVDLVAQPLPLARPSVPAVVGAHEYWIDVDLSRQVLSLYRYNTPVFSTFVASGLGYFPTRTGTYRLKSKLLSTRMSGGPPRFPAPYDLKNVPFTMYYSGDFAIHGTYWHDKFGSQQSHGCTNLTQGDAEYIFNHALPNLPLGVRLAYASLSNLGTIVYIHY